MVSKLKARALYYIRSSKAIYYITAVFIAVLIGAMVGEDTANLLIRTTGLSSESLWYIAAEIILSLIIINFAVVLRTHKKRKVSEIDERIARDLFVMLNGDDSAGYLEVYIQPKICLQTYERLSGEALVRWHHPELGILTPDSFINIAERMGLINKLSSQVVDLTCKILHELREDGHAFKVSINLSGINLVNPDFVKSISSFFNKAGCQPEQITLEITETAAINDLGQSRFTLLELKKQGFRISMDDFGTGYASMSTLHKLPFDEIKIDKSFISTLENDPVSQAIVSASILLALELKMKIVAEGVENETVLNTLKTLGVHMAQGYYFSKPMPVSELRSWLKHQNSSMQAAFIAPIPEITAA